MILPCPAPMLCGVFVLGDGQERGLAIASAFNAKRPRLAVEALMILSRLRIELGGAKFDASSTKLILQSVDD